MLVRSVPERALGALLGGKPAADVLYRHLVEFLQNQAAAVTPINLSSLRKALIAAVQTDIDERTGRRHRLNEAQQAAKDLCSPPFLDRAEIPAFDETFDAVMVLDGDTLHFRDEQVQRYAEVLSEIDPTLLVAWHLVKRTELPARDATRTLDEAVTLLTTLFVGPRFFSAPFAEGHVHLGGIAGNEHVLAQLVLGHQWPPKIAAQEPHMNRFRRIRRMLMAFTTNWGDGDAVDSQAALAHETALLNACLDDAQLAAPNPTIDWGFLQRGIVIQGEGEVETDCPEVRSADHCGQPVNARWLLRRLAAAATTHDLQHAWIWLFILLWRTYRGNAAGPATRAAVLLLVADIMVLRRQLVMDGSGLRRFATQFFHSPLRKGAAAHETWPGTSVREAARRLFARPGDKAEIKICIGSLETHDAPVAFARAANACIQTLAGKGAPQAAHTGANAGHAHSRSHWHFCAHFNRVAESSRAKLWEQAKALYKVLHSQNPWDLASGIEPRHLALPAQLIRGLDVVGDETRWSIEMFAPMLRWLRPQEDAHSSRGDSDKTLMAPTPRLHLSIHAGEDYAHPLSGLRHVDETVRFCKMRAGDRLGHALALGIPPDEWLHRHGEVLLSVDEHFDNLIWAWREAVELDHLKEAQRVRPRLAARIARMLPHVSWYPWKKGMPAPTWADLMRLHEAWRLRENCAYKVLQQVYDTEVGGPELDAGVPDLSRLREQGKNPSMNTAEGLYVLRARLEVNSPTAAKKPLRQVRLTAQRHGHVTRGQQRLESLDVDVANYLHDHDDAHDFRFMLALQDSCIERYARLGLSIETNPSSNVYIGQLQTHSDHPIYRWNPPNGADLGAGGKFNQFNLRERPMPVTINTDDPGIIPTTLRMEHHLMHEAAIDRGHPEVMADAWIERLRQLGMTHFEAAH